MKAQRITNNNRILTTLTLLVFAISFGHGQGLLAEGAIKLFKAGKQATEETTPKFIFVDYSIEKENKFNLKNFVRDAFSTELEKNAELNINRTIHVSAIEISFESEMETEEWMTSPLENNLEAGVAVESWMTESLNESVESNLTAESWMAESFNTAVESNLAVESWMTESFAGSLEAEIVTEEWMTMPISESLESEIEVEDWMTVSLTSDNEEELIVENWMTQSLISK